MLQLFPKTKTFLLIRVTACCNFVAFVCVKKEFLANFVDLEDDLFDNAAFVPEDLCDPSLSELECLWCVAEPG